ncbi:MAG: hypothetical protein ABI559_11685 [Chloroflexota bacterium]
MRYFPQRARNRDIGKKLKICTYCLGDMFTDGKCVQCNSRNGATPALRQAIMQPVTIFQKPIAQ